VVSVPPHTSQRLQQFDVSYSTPLEPSKNRECRLFMRTHPCGRNSVVIEHSVPSHCRHCKAVSEVAKTDIYPLNPDVFSEEDFISGEVPSTGSATMKVDSPSPIRGVTDSGYERGDTSSRGVTDSSGEAVTIAVISPFPSLLGWQIQRMSRPISSPKSSR
jgi:hypothetical protein